MAIFSRNNKRQNVAGPGPSRLPAWWRAALFAVVSLVIAVQAAISTAAYIAAERAPQMALWIDPDNARALSEQADLLAATGKMDQPAVTLKRMSRQSLRTMALNPVALRQYASSVGLADKRAEMLDVLALSQRLTRRDTGTQMLLIEEAIDANNAARALNHYDMVLRTAPALREGLFSRLLVIVSNPELRQQLSVLMRRNPNWLPSFVDYAAYSSKQPELIADLLVRAGPLPEELRGSAGVAQIIARVAADGPPDGARRLFGLLPGAPVAMLENPSLDAPGEAFDTPPLSWELLESAQVSGQWVGAGKERGIVAVGQSLSSDIFARRMLFLKPGNHGLRFSVDLQAMAKDSQYLVETSCRAADGSKGPVNRFRITGRGATVPLIVAGDCPAQSIELKLKTAESDAESIAVTTAITLTS